jgi:hypothetical protein
MLYNWDVVIDMYEYKSQKELYQTLKPAFNVKLRLLRNGDYNSIKSIDIWNYLKINKWTNSVDLTLADMVNDIIHVDNKDIDIYWKKRNGNEKVGG